MTYKPPFDITPEILSLSEAISREVGILIGLKIDKAPVKLRKLNNIKTIQSSLAIEGNTLSLDQITHLLEGKKVIGPQKDILEVENAILIYNHLNHYNPLRIDDLLKAHDKLMTGLTDDAGIWRKGTVAILKGDTLTHMPPPADRVPYLMQDIFDFLNKDTTISWLLKACIFHYELEFIHPFSDGNGRMGRLWQQLILMKYDPIFEYLSVEELIKQNQKDYYAALSASDKAGNSTQFLAFSLKQILNALTNYKALTSPNMHTPQARLDYAALKIEKDWFSRKDYMDTHKDISTATASRDLLYGLDQNILKKRGDKNQTLYRFL